MNQAPEKIVDRIDAYFGNIARWSIRHRYFIAFLALLAVGYGGYCAGHVRIDNSLSNFFYKDDEAYLAYKEYLDDFVSDEVVYILYNAESREHGPFNYDVMQRIARLTETLEAEVPFVREATSLANVEFMRPRGEDDIEIDELLINFPESQAEMLQIKQFVMSKPIYVDYLINSAADHAAIILQMSATSTDELKDTLIDPTKPVGKTNSYPMVADAKVREILARPEFSGHGINYFVSGDVPMNTTYIGAMINDMTYITLGALLIIMMLCVVVFRATVAGILGPLTVVVVSVLLTVAFICTLNWTIGNFFSLLPTLICAVGIAQSVHILLEYQRQLSRSGDANQAVIRALSKVGGPCFMAALTTAAGFSVMSVSNLKMLAEFGVYSAFGIMTAFFLSTTLLVVFLARKPRKFDRSKQGRMAVTPLIKPIVDKSIDWNLKYPNQILGISALIFVLAFMGITQLRNDFNFLSEFKPHVEWRKATLKVEEEMGGTLHMSYLIDTKIPEGIKSAKLIKQIEDIQRFAEQNPLVKKTQSVADMMKDLNQTFRANDPAYYRVPDRQNLLSQYFLVYEMSGGKELEEFVSHDFSRTVIEFQVEMTSASNVEKLLAEIDAFVAQNPLDNATGNKTGIGLLWVKLANYIGDTQLTSYPLVFAMIALIMCISFGSIKVGLLSMIPNLTPVALALGALGWLNVPLDYMKLLLATIAISIAVDDTIHLVTRFRVRFYSTGSYEQALRLGLNDVGPALVATSFILVVAFLAFLGSNTTVLANFGVLLGGTITAALIADLLLMPVILLKFKPFGPEFTPAP
ncbi:MAG: MMPL family transporter [Gammaproteobacteria bacterium]|nr:MMPL family transporter [Gammaproteobacteria bacterium]